MKIYLVGGAIRDKLLGLPVKEHDWVVVGSTVDEMLSQGFRLVGKEFPVFLHPKTHDEYALARTEKKTGPGYKGFAVDTSLAVSLEEDLSRRDLTINAMAESEDGILIDPYHGKADLDHRLLRHVSNAFSEDPVRILRVARFLARYQYLGFRIAEETNILMREMTEKGEVDALVPERVWKECQRALTEKNPEAFFIALDACGGLRLLFPALTLTNPGFDALKKATLLTASETVRFAALLHALTPDDIVKLCKRFRVPNQFRQLAELTAKYHEKALTAASLPASAIIDLFYALDIFRRKERFHDFLLACKAIAPIKSEFDTSWLLKAAEVAFKPDPKLLLLEGLSGDALAKKLRALRTEEINAWLHLAPHKQC